MRLRNLLQAVALASASLGATLGATLGAAGDDDAHVMEALYPEGPLWEGDRLYFAEMRADRITVTDAQGPRVFFERQGCGPTAIAPYGEGYLILCHLAALIVAVDAKGAELRRWDSDRDGIRLADPNDASADGRGGVYFTDPGPFARTARPHGRIMHLSAGGVLTSVAGALWYPNGVHVRGGALYVSEHLGGRILRYDIGADGRLEAPHVVVDFSRVPRPVRYLPEYRLAGPDGLEFGPDGALYVAIYGEGLLLTFSEQGDFLRAVETPTRFLTNIAFGEPGVALTGTFDNKRAPYRGEVRIQRSVP